MRYENISDILYAEREEQDQHTHLNFNGLHLFEPQN